MGENTLFKAEEMQDSTATAIQESDTRIQRMSKIFAKRTNLSSDTCHLMIAYQRGAIDMKNIVLEALCRDCRSGAIARKMKNMLIVNHTITLVEYSINNPQNQTI